MAHMGETPSPVVFDMELELEEDVDASLEDFIFRARLGLKGRARQLAEHVLWRHIDFFPVFAEICAFYIVCRDRGAVLELIADLAASSIVFSDPDEQDFVKMAALFARGRLRNPAVAHDQTMTASESRDQARSRARETDLLLLHDADYSSTAQLQNIELRFWESLFAESEGHRITAWIELAVNHLNQLVAHSLIREAAEIFHCICAYLRETGETYDIWALYDSSFRNSASIKACSTPARSVSHTAQIQDSLLIRLKVKVGLSIASDQAVPSRPMDSSMSLQEIKSLVLVLVHAEFGDLPTEITSDMLTEIEEFHGIAETPTYDLTFQDGSVASDTSSHDDSLASSYAPSIFDHTRPKMWLAGLSDSGSVSSFAPSHVGWRAATVKQTSTSSYPVPPDAVNTAGVKISRLTGETSIMNERSHLQAKSRQDAQSNTVSDKLQHEQNLSSEATSLRGGRTALSQFPYRSQPITEHTEGWPKPVLNSLHTIYQGHYGRDDINRAFAVGSLLAVFRHENYGSQFPPEETRHIRKGPALEKLGMSGYVAKTHGGELIYRDVRRFIIIDEREDFSIGIPIMIYGSQGTTTKSLTIKERVALTIVYSVGDKPTLLPGEPKYRKEPIAVKMKTSKTLPPSSRLDYGKPSSIEHTIKVELLGNVVSEHVTTLLLDFRKELFPLRQLANFQSTSYQENYEIGGGDRRTVSAANTLLPENHRSPTGISDAADGLPPLLAKFLNFAESQYSSCATFCQITPQIWEEDFRALESLALELLRQNKVEDAHRAAQRYLMLVIAIRSKNQNAYLGRLRYPSKREQFTEMLEEYFAQLQLHASREITSRRKVRSGRDAINLDPRAGGSSTLGNGRSLGLPPLAEEVREHLEEGLRSPLAQSS